MSQQPQQQQQKSTGMSGCAIALIIVGALAVLGVVVMAVGVLVFMRSDTGQALTSTATSIAGGQSAQGTRELRAAGCHDAWVMDFKAMSDLVDRLAPDAGPPVSAEVGVVVVCSDPPAAMTCEQAVAVYAKASPAHVSVINLSISDTGKPQERCAGTWDRAGRRLPDAAAPPAAAPAR